VNLFLEIKGEDGLKKTELPLRLLVLGDFKGREDEQPLEDREKINVNKDNFSDVMSSMQVHADLFVPNRLEPGGEELEVHLDIKNLDSLHPESIAQQVPELRRLLAMRNLLLDLRNRVITAREFRKRLESTVADRAALKDLLAELDRLVPATSQER
jgi:type VI secretion system protein ImpB